MTIHDLAFLVRKMRMAQKRYFAGRQVADLDDAKALERSVDQECFAILTAPLRPGAERAPAQGDLLPSVEEGE